MYASKANNYEFVRANIDALFVEAKKVKQIVDEYLGTTNEVVTPVIVNTDEEAFDIQHYWTHTALLIVLLIAAARCHRPA